eukprot:356133-Chlamydomonas_euryale.AAC.35
MVLQQQRKSDEAEAVLRRALSSSEREFGPEHPDTLAVVRKLAPLLREQVRVLHGLVLGGEWREAGWEWGGCSCFEITRTFFVPRCLWWTGTAGADSPPHCRFHLLPRHPLHALTLSAPASPPHPQGKLAEAEALLWRQLQSMDASLGLDHRETLATADALAALLLERGRPEVAEKLYRRIVDSQRRTAHPDSPRLIASLEALAGTLQARQWGHGRRYGEEGRADRAGVRGRCEWWVHARVWRAVAPVGMVSKWGERRWAHGGSGEGLRMEGAGGRWAYGGSADGGRNAHLPKC